MAEIKPSGENENLYQKVVLNTMSGMFNMMKDQRPHAI